MVLPPDNKAFGKLAGYSKPPLISRLVVAWAGNAEKAHKEANTAFCRVRVTRIFVFPEVNFYWVTIRISGGLARNTVVAQQKATGVPATDF
jgi:hypothetical protein